jgi:hypothetical protein
VSRRSAGEQRRDKKSAAAGGKVVSVVKNKEPLEGLESIKQIKSGMNTLRSL